MINELRTVYCDEMLAIIDVGNLYISKQYKVAIHLCACGCGQKTVTPICKGEWRLTEIDGKVSLHPSIGNFRGEKPYHAHYFITNNKIRWC